jgi:uncharacterized membrane protein YphA (DoxX/SURF4 family)
MKKPPEFTFLYLTQLVVGFVWLHSSYSKFADITFVNNLPKTLAYFASKNPFPWYVQFLQNWAIPNASLFAELTRWGELVAGILLVTTAVTALGNKKLAHFHKIATLGLLIGAFLNLQFGLAASWTSPSTEVLNVLMLAIGVIFVFYHRSAAMKK